MQKQCLIEYIEKTACQPYYSLLNIEKYNKFKYYEALAKVRQCGQMLFRCRCFGRGIFLIQ